jgi:hypothetical protein
MATREIPASDWPAFFDFLSSMAAGWLVTVEATSDRGAPETRAYQVPLDDIRADEHEVVIVLREVRGPLRFTIPDVAHVRFTEDPGRGQNAVEVASQHGPMTRVSFQPLPLPTQIDGLLA